jgi:putative RNA 2'-phosphotransferase
VVGRRREWPLVLDVKTCVMPRDGWGFYRSGDGMWLVEHIPSRYLSRRRSGV